MCCCTSRPLCATDCVCTYINPMAAARGQPVTRRCCVSSRVAVSSALLWYLAMCASGREIAEARVYLFVLLSVPPDQRQANTIRAATYNVFSFAEAWCTVDPLFRPLPMSIRRHHATDRSLRATVMKARPLLALAHWGLPPAACAEASSTVFCCVMPCGAASRLATPSVHPTCVSAMAKGKQPHHRAR